MSLVLSGGLLLAPALASRIDQPAPSTLVADGNATGDLTSAIEPVADLAQPLPARAMTDVEEGPALSLSDEHEDPAPGTTTTTHVHPPPKAVKVAAAPKAAPTAGPPVKPTVSVAPAPKPSAKADAKPAPKPEAQPEPKLQAAASEERNPWADPKNETETLACIRWVETRGDYTAVSPSGQYRGAYQMDDTFWRYYGGDEDLTGHHEKASPAQQDAVATRGLHDRGLDPWPSAVEECA